MHTKWNKLRDELAGMYLERDSQIQGIILALLASQHVLLLGVPGTAKSAIIKSLTRRIVGARYFEKQLTKFSGPEEVFGPTSIAALQADIFKRKIEGYMPEAEIAYVDECFKANSAILNSFLSIMAEREFKNGTDMVKCPLISMIGASNETPQEESLSAMYDRFMLKFVASYVSDSNFATLMRMDTLIEQAESDPNKTTLTLEEVKTSMKEVSKVTLPDNVVEMLVNLRAEMRKEGFGASDRRWMASKRILQASAFMEGRKEVVIDDLLIYKDILWDDMNRATKCAAIVGKIVNPVFAQIQEHVDAIDILIKDFVAKGGGENLAIEAWVKIKSHQERLADLSGGERGEVLKAKTRERVQNTLARAMGIGAKR